jgi:hypothetical protein
MEEEEKHGKQVGKPNHDRVRVLVDIVTTIILKNSINKNLGGLGRSSSTSSVIVQFW